MPWWPRLIRRAAPRFAVLAVPAALLVVPLGALPASAATTAVAPVPVTPPGSGTGGGTATGATIPATDTSTGPAPDPSPTGSSGTAADATSAGPVILLGTTGLRWNDVTDSAVALNALLSEGAIGSLSVRGVRESTCPVDGWLAVSTGRRSADAPDAAGAACRTPVADIPKAAGSGTVPRWATYREQAARDGFDARPGLLGDTLREAGLRAAAVGPGAVIALAGSDGTVAHAWPGLNPAVGGGADVGADASTLADQVRAALNTDPALLVIDIGALRDPAPGTDQPSRTDQVTELDNRLQLVFGEIPASATVFVTSLADSSETPHLQLAAAYGKSGAPPARGRAPSGPAFAHALLSSSSTRQPGLAQARDLQPSLLTALGRSVPANAPGAPLRPTEAGGTGPDRLARLLDLNRAVRAVRPVVPVFFAGLGAAVLATVVGSVWAMARLRGPIRRRERTLRALRRWSVVPAAVPVAVFLANLLPWWRAGAPGAVLAACVVGLTVPVAAVALLGPWRSAPLGPMGVIGVVTAVVLAIDVMTGSRLVLVGLMGLHPLIGGRFYGFGNQAFAVFATGTLLAALAGADALHRRGRPRAAVGLVAAVGVLAVVVDGTPGWGSDFGGPAALFVAFAVLALRVAGLRVTRWRAIATVTAAVAVLAGLSVLDWLRSPATRTHLGRFVQSLLDGDAGPVVARKLSANLEMLAAPLGVLGAACTLLVVVALARPARFRLAALEEAYRRFPLLRPGLAAIGALVLIGFLGNDSGVVIPVDAGMLVVPLALTAALRAQELRDADRLTAAVEAARRPARPRRRGGRPSGPGAP